jgi:hypothetical protein
MPRKENFRITDKSVEIMFPTLGVLSVSGAQESDETIIGAYYDNSEEGKGTYVLTSSNGIRYFDLDKSQVASAGESATKLVFQDDTNVYLIRKLVSEDGSWISKYKVPVPAEVLESKVSLESRPIIEQQLGSSVPQGGFLPFFESMVIYYREDVGMIAEVIYMTSAGTYFRQESGWAKADMSDEKYEDLFVAELSLDRAKDFLDAYDRNASMSVEEALSYTSNS